MPQVRLGLESGSLLSLKAKDWHPRAPTTYLSCLASSLFRWAWPWHGGQGSTHAASTVGLYEDSEWTDMKTESAMGQMLDPTSSRKSRAAPAISTPPQPGPNAMAQLDLCHCSSLPQPTIGGALDRHHSMSPGLQRAGAGEGEADPWRLPGRGSADLRPGG